MTNRDLTQGGTFPVELLANFPGQYAGLFKLAKLLDRKIIVLDAYLAGFADEGLVEIAWMEFSSNEGAALGTFWSPVRPEGRISEKASQFHRVYWRHVKEAPSASHLWATQGLGALLGEQPLVLGWDLSRFKLKSLVASLARGSATGRSKISITTADLRPLVEQGGLLKQSELKVTIPSVCKSNEVAYFKTGRVYSDVMSVAALWSRALDAQVGDALNGSIASNADSSVRLQAYSLPVQWFHMTVFQASKTIPKDA